MTLGYNLYPGDIVRYQDTIAIIRKITSRETEIQCGTEVKTVDESELHWTGDSLTHLPRSEWKWRKTGIRIRRNF